jgi:rRNA maturation endonuclease Nob1
VDEVERAIDTCKRLSLQVNEMIADDLSITAVNALLKEIPIKYKTKDAIFLGNPIKQMICGKCGMNIYSKDQKYCSECGTKIRM